MVAPLTFVPGGTEILVEIKLPDLRTPKDGMLWRCPPQGMSVEAARDELREQMFDGFLDQFLPLRK